MSGFPLQQPECRGEHQRADLQREDARQCGAGAGEPGSRENQSQQYESQVSAEVRQKSRKVQQADATKEVARLELQLSQQIWRSCNRNSARAR